MEKKNKFQALIQAHKSGLAFKGGSYSMLVSLIVLAILVAVNVFASALPQSLTQYDISSQRLYSVTSSTKVVVNSLEKDVTIYWICQDGSEDTTLQLLLSKYASLSSHISVIKINPDVYPNFAAQYTDNTVTNNSMIVECGDVSRYISYADVYPYEYGIDYTTYSYTYEYYFDAEGLITSAVDYVVSDDIPLIYLLEGHGEGDLPDDLATQIERSNIDTDTLSLLTVDEIPEDAAAILIYAPTSDISEEEKEMLADWVLNQDGKLLVISGPQQDTQLTVLESLLSDYDITVSDGVLVETDRNYYAYYPYMLLPEIQSDDITDDLISGSYYIVMPISFGMTLGSTSLGTVTELLTTSDTAIYYADGYYLSSYDLEDGDTEGSFALAVSITSSASDGQLIWFGSSYFVEDIYNSYSSDANLNLVMNSISALVGESDAISIPAKSLSTESLTISDASALTLKVVLIGAFPILYLGIGVGVMVFRRRLQNEKG